MEAETIEVPQGDISLPIRLSNGKMKNVEPVSLGHMSNFEELIPVPEKTDFWSRSIREHANAYMTRWNSTSLRDTFVPILARPVSGRTSKDTSTISLMIIWFGGFKERRDTNMTENE